MTTSTDRDTTKATTLRLDGVLDLISDTACAADCSSDHESLFELIESARRLLWLAAAEHLPGIRWEDGRPQCTEAGWREIHTYQDGTPVKQSVELGIDGLGLADYFPRYDGPLVEYIALFAEPKRHLHAVETEAGE